MFKRNYFYHISYQFSDNDKIGTADLLFNVNHKLNTVKMYEELKMIIKSDALKRKNAEIVILNVTRLKR